MTRSPHDIYSVYFYSSHKYWHIRYVQKYPDMKNIQTEKDKNYNGIYNNIWTNAFLVAIWCHIFLFFSKRTREVGVSSFRFCGFCQNISRCIDSHLYLLWTRGNETTQQWGERGEETAKSLRSGLTFTLIFDWAKNEPCLLLAISSLESLIIINHFAEKFYWLPVSILPTNDFTCE